MRESSDVLRAARAKQSALSDAAGCHALKLCGWRWPAGKRSAQTFFKQWSAVLGALVLCHQAEQLPVLRRVRSTKFFSLFAHKGGDRQWSEAELPVAGKGASLLYIGALVLKCDMVGVAGMLV